MSREVFEVNEKTGEGFKKIMQGEFDGMEESLKPFLEIMAKHVVNERQKVSWVVLADEKHVFDLSRAAQVG